MLDTAHAVWSSLSTGDASPDLERSCGNYIVQVWFTPDLCNPTHADVYIVDAANLIPADAKTVAARDAVTAFRHPSLWSKVIRESLRVTS